MLLHPAGVMAQETVAPEIGSPVDESVTVPVIVPFVAA
jgi:hypothetical protein